MLGRNRCSPENKCPHAENREEVDRKNSAAEPNICGENLDASVKDSASDKQPCKGDGELVCCIEEMQEHARHVEERRPLKLIGQVGANARLECREWVRAIRTTSNPPDCWSPRNGQQRVQNRREQHVREHWENKLLEHRRTYVCGLTLRLTGVPKARPS